MQQITPKYDKQIFVCIMNKEHKESCAPKDAVEIHRRLKAYVKENNIPVRVSKSYCQGLCSQGPIVSIFPDNIYYKEVSLEDVNDIIKKHLRMN